MKVSVNKLQHPLEAVGRGSRGPCTLAWGPRTEVQARPPSGQTHQARIHNRKTAGARNKRVCSKRYGSAALQP